MSKKQLEEIESKINCLEFRPLQIVIINQLIDYAKEQTKRVQEFESEYEVRQVCYLEEHIERLESENKRYKEALEFYADMENHEEYEHRKSGLIIDVVEDGGETARSALNND